MRKTCAIPEIKEIRKKAPEYIISSKEALFIRVGNFFALSGNQFFIDGPCRSFYDFDYDDNGVKKFNFRISWLRTLDISTNISLVKDETYIPMGKKIIIDSVAIQKNCVPNNNFPICHIFENDELKKSCYNVKINGPSMVYYDASREGAYKTWIETNSEIEIMDSSN